ncbi:hypothetical protein pb186bvf_017092 [Paramecium bursaria]
MFYIYIFTIILQQFYNNFTYIKYFISKGSQKNIENLSKKKGQEFRQTKLDRNKLPNYYKPNNQGQKILQALKYQNKNNNVLKKTKNQVHNLIQIDQIFVSRILYNSDQDFNNYDVIQSRINCQIMHQNSQKKIFFINLFYIHIKSQKYWLFLNFKMKQGLFI